MTRRIGFLLLLFGLGTPALVSAQSSAGVDEEARGREAGVEAATRLSGAWFVKGLLGGLVAGPIGTAAAFGWAGNSPVAVPPELAPDPVTHTPLYSEAFRQAYREQLRMKRRESAFVGGMLGTAVFAWWVLRSIDLIGGAEVGGEPPGGGNETI